MPTLKIQNNSAFNPLTLDLSTYLDLTDGSDIDPANPSFSNKVISHSLLKEGGVLALEDFQNKELVFPLRLQAASTTALNNLIAQINQIVTSPGATYSWQDDGASQPTIFDAISGEFDIKYSYRKSSSSAHWMDGDLKLFTMPFGHTAGPRAYAAASGVAPLLYVAPSAYLAGNPSPGHIAYAGAPSLAGDAPALLVLDYVGASSIPGLGNASQTLAVAAVSLLPDATYQPMLIMGNDGGWSTRAGASIPGQSLLSLPQSAASASNLIFGTPTPSQISLAKAPVTWGGLHRLLVLARASGTWGQLSTNPDGQYVSSPTVASVGPPGNAFALYDLGAFSIRPSEIATRVLGLSGAIPSVAGVGANAALDVGGVIMLPDNATWFAGGSALVTLGNLIYIDDTLGDQFADVFNATSAPSQWNEPVRITQYTRGLVPRPDPKYGVPILALLGVGASGLSWPFPLMSAQVNVLERVRYQLP